MSRDLSSAYDQIGPHVTRDAVRDAPAAMAVASHATDAADARELLDMLGLADAAITAHVLRKLARFRVA